MSDHAHEWSSPKNKFKGEIRPTRASDAGAPSMTDLEPLPGSAPHRDEDPRAFIAQKSISDRRIAHSNWKIK